MPGYCWSMGIPYNLILDLIEKAKSWISWGKIGLNSISGELQMTGKSCKICYQCDSNLSEFSLKYQCRSCGRVLCGNCVHELASGHLKETKEAVFDIKFCKFCFELGPWSNCASMYSGKVYPSESPRQSPESPSPSFSGERFDDLSACTLAKNMDTSFLNHPSPVSDPRSPSRYVPGYIVASKFLDHVFVNFEYITYYVLVFGKVYYC